MGNPKDPLVNQYLSECIESSLAYSGTPKLQNIRDIT